jgi:hypothetical protein
MPPETRLESTARAALARHGYEPADAVPDFRRRMYADNALAEEAAMFVLSHFAALGRKPGVAAVGQPRLDAHRSLADSGDPNPIPVREHRRARPERERTEAEKMAARQVEGLYSLLILGSPLGRLHWREIPEVDARLADQMDRGLVSAEEAAKQRLVLAGCRNYATPPDHSVMIADVVPIEALVGIIADAEREVMARTNAARAAFSVPQLEHHA